MKDDHHFEVLSVDSVRPVSGWWIEERLEPIDDDDTLDILFHPTFGVASITARTIAKKEIRLSLPVTLGELKQLNYNALIGEGAISINDQSRIYRHDVDFKVLGKELTADPQNRGEV